MNLNSERQQECDDNLDNGHQSFSKSEMIELKNQNGEDLNEEDLKWEKKEKKAYYFNVFVKRKIENFFKNVNLIN